MYGPAGEVPKDIWDFADSILKRGERLASSRDRGARADSVWAPCRTRRTILCAELNDTRDTGPWPDPLWESVAATVSQGKVTATLPQGTKVYYLNLFDDRDCAVSTEHVEE